MSTDHLTTTAPADLTKAVLAVLSDTPIKVAASAINTPPENLTAMVELYQNAGREALETHAAGHDWYQINVKFPGSADAAVTALGQHLDSLHDLVDAWWFIRKKPGLKLRLRLRAATTDTRTAVNAALNDLASSGAISRWGTAIYEPETAAFGSGTGMDIAHDLFCADSRHIVTYLRRPAANVGRREVSMLLLGTMLSTSLDRFERGDVWHRVAELRPLPETPPPGQLEALADKIRPLVASPLGPITPAGPLAFAAPWADNFRHAGQSLYEAATAGHLTRGIRHIFGHHVIFHWNRLGLPATTQGVLSRAACEALLPAGSRP
ncbi:thiopeptide-type bacteriocin biosynthesis protein [Nonomuraea thailandensis]|uniref:Thiopeptide-type bacteriocin biosynthesis protein n=1 Tax=Nonomuraea thailandensis TaxID=1188745 RepID=A0A9X2K445_9ACTN|nr:thiopeptide-type bacteriocin biosynthesis protein [Nonomuraea thailandensis]MCP2359708.1 thiopeptide-type bacteriocin biosynthesis protein [Nonomuraea thailandensis]